MFDMGLRCLIRRFWDVWYGSEMLDKEVSNMLKKYLIPSNRKFKYEMSKMFDYINCLVYLMILINNISYDTE